MTKRLIITGFMLTCFILLVNCGGGSSGGSGSSAPADYTITINPTTIEVKDGSPTTSDHIGEFQIVVKDKNGTPVRDVELRISYIWANPDSYGAVQLLDGDNPVNSPFYAKTDENGSYMARLLFKSGGIEYEADLQVTSGSLFKSATFKVSAS